jgi:stage V sporulation protein SpoVS
MHFLLAQFMFRKSPKAAMKALDGYISDATAYASYLLFVLSAYHSCRYQHYSWVYALRFLRASYSAESGNATDTHAAIQNLREIAKLSSQQSDRAIYLAVSLMETMVHLKSNGPDAIEQAQRALAAAWKYQLDSGAQIPQLTALAHILDVVCSIRQGNPTAMVNKLREMQMMMDGALKDPIWSSTDDTIAIPINGRNSSQVVSPDTRVIIGIGADGRDNLMMPFLSAKDAYSLTYVYPILYSLKVTEMTGTSWVEWY